MHCGRSAECAGNLKAWGNGEGRLTCRWGPAMRVTCGLRHLTQVDVGQMVEGGPFSFLARGLRRPDKSQLRGRE